MTDPRGRPLRIAAWVLAPAAAAANAAGYAFHLWDVPVWYDEVVHGGTLLALTLVLALLLHGRVLGGAARHPVLLALTIAAIGLGVGALWEIAEWAYDLWAPGNAILGKWDTVTDLVADGVGSLAAGTLVALAWHRRRPSPGEACDEP